MDLSIFLARFFGFYFIIFGAAYFFRRAFLVEMVKNFYKNAAMVLIGVFMSIVFGLLIVLSHNIWEFSWRVIITIIGYISLLKGLLNLYATDWMMKFSTKFIKSKNAMFYMGLVAIAIGFALLYQGYWCM